MGHRVLGRCHQMPFGASLLAGGGARFRLWAPSAQRVDLSLRSGSTSVLIPMRPGADGWYECEAQEARAGSRYAFRIDGGIEVPDPVSRSNPDDVHRPSAVIDPLSYAWRDADWRGRPWTPQSGEAAAHPSGPRSGVAP